MNKVSNLEGFAEVDRSVRTRLALANESTYSYLVRITAMSMFKNPRDFVSHMRTVQGWLEPQLTERTRPLYDEMTRLVTLIEKERPRSRIWHPPLTVRLAKSVTKAATARYNEQRQQVMALFEQAHVSHQMEPFVAAQEKFREAQSKRGAENYILSERQQADIVKIYTDAVSAGSVYGVVKQLAINFGGGVSTTAIHAILRKHGVKAMTTRPKKSIDKQRG